LSRKFCGRATVAAFKRLGAGVVRRDALSLPKKSGADCDRMILRFCFGFEFHVAVGEFDGVFDVLAVELLANLFRLFLNEAGE